MRSHGRLMRSLIIAALLCAAACSQAPEGTEGTQQAPVNAEDAPAAGAAPRPAAAEGGRAEANAEKPTVVIIKSDGPNSFYADLKTAIDRIAEKYEGRVVFKLLDNGANGLTEVVQHPQFKEISAFYNKYKSASGTAAIFRTGVAEPTVVNSEGAGGRMVDEAAYRREFDERLSEVLSARPQSVATSATPPASRAATGGAAVTPLALEQVEKRVAALEGAGWLDGWAGPALLGGLALLTLLSLVAAGMSLLMARSFVSQLKELRQDFEHNKGLAEESRRAAQEWRDKANAVLGDLNKKGRTDVRTEQAGGGLGQLQSQLAEQGRQLGDVLRQLSGLDQRLSQTDLQTKQSLAETIGWLGRLHSKGAWADGGPGTEEEREALTARAEGYAARLRSLAEQVEPLTTAMANLAQSPGVAASQGLYARVLKLYEDIHRFEDAERRLEVKLHSLRNGSTDQRRARFESAEGDLRRRSDGMSPPDLVKEYRLLFEQHYPDGPKGGADGAGAEPLSADEAERLLSGAQDHLMDWFSNYTQLLSQTQAAVADAPQAARGVTEEMAGVLAVAREVLRGFDILPVEIQLGQTAFDHRLYDAAMIKATTQYPPNTVIQVQRAGFRRISTGEVLRRPQVIISGASTAV